MAAFNYMLDTPNPGAAFLQSFQMARQQQVQQERQRGMLRDLQSLRTNPSPQKFADFYLMYPEMKEQVDAYRSTLQDADKNALLGGAQEAMAFAQAGKTDQVVSSFRKRAEAARQSNRPDLAKQFDDAASFYETSPEAGNFALRMMYNTLDPDGYKNVFGGGENKIADKISELAPFVGEDNAKRIVLAQQAAQGVVSVSGPGGTVFQRADEVFALPISQQPQAAASFVAGEPQAEAMTVDQFMAAADALGIGKAVGMIERNNIPIKVKTPAEAKRLPSGTRILLPDGSEGRVP